MRIILTLSILLFISCVSKAQKMIIFDTIVVHPEIGTFLKKNPQIENFTFWPGYISFKTKKVWCDTSYNLVCNDYVFFNLNFPGDVYLLNKYYSSVKIPTEIFSILEKKTCDQYYHIETKAHNDSVFYNLKYECEKDTDENLYFQKVEINTRYITSLNTLERKIEARLSQNLTLNPTLEDSVVLIEAFLKAKDSSLLNLKIIEGNYTEFSQKVMEELKVKKMWLPSLAGGRPVNSYFKLFFRIDKNKKVFAYINK